MAKEPAPTPEARRVPGTGGEMSPTQLLKPIELPTPLERLNHELAVKLAKENPDIAGQLIMALVAHNTAALPGTAFVRREEGVFIKKHRTTVRLAESEGHLIPVRRKVTKKGKPGAGDDEESTVEYVPGWDYSLNGLLRLNEMPALMIIRPERVIVDGQAQMNPYIQVNPASRMPEVVYARCLVAGYSPMGSLVATDVMVRLDVNIYLLENLQAKMKKLKAAADSLAEYGTADKPPMLQGDKPRPGRWAFMPLHSVGGIGLWFNLGADAAKEVLRDHTTRLKFIERLAQSFAKRNALREHPTMPKTCLAENGVVYVRVEGWTTDFDRKEIDHLRELMEQDKLETFRDRAGNQIKVKSVEVTELQESDVEDLNQDAAEQSAGEAAEDKPEVDGPGTDDLLPKAAELYGRLITLKTKAGAKKILADHEIKDLEEATAAQLQAFITAAEGHLGT